MSGALIASVAAGSSSTVIFIDAMTVANGSDTAGSSVTFAVPASAQIGDIVLFYCLGNAQGATSNPPGGGWQDAGAAIPGTGGVVYVKRMATSSDLTVRSSGSGGYIGFTVYRGAASFQPVPANGFNRSQYHAGVAFFGSPKPAPATPRLTLNANTGSGTASEMIPPLTYQSGTNYAQYAAVEFRSQ